MAGQGKLSAFLTHLTAMKFPGRRDESVGGLATACLVKARTTRRAQARSAPRSFTLGCTNDAAFTYAGFVGVEKQVGVIIDTLKVGAVVSDC